MTAQKDSKDVIKGAMVNFLGIIARSLNFAFFIVLGRFYGADSTGVYLLCWTFIDVSSKLGILGLDRAVLVKAAKKKALGDDEGVNKNIAQALMIGLLASATVCALIYFCASPFGERFYDKPELIRPLRIMAFGIPFWAVSAVLLFATRAVRIMKYEVIVKSVLEPLVMLGGAIIFHRTGKGVDGLAIAFVVSTAVGALAATFCFCRVYSFKGIIASFFRLEGIGGLLRFATPIGIYDMLNLILQRIGMFMLGLYAPVAAVGIYGLTEESSFTIKKIRQAFDPILIPVISSNEAENNRVAMKMQYCNVTRWILVLDLAALGFVIIAGRSVLMLFGAEFSAGALAFSILALSILINGVLGVSELFILISRPALNVANTVGAIVINLALNFLLIPDYGMVGAATAICITYALMNTARLIEVAAIHRLHPFTGHHLSALAAFFAALLPVAVAARFLEFEIWQELSAGLLFVVLYAAISLRLNPARERRRFFKRLRGRFHKGDNE